MSFAGLRTYSDNLKKLMGTESFKKGDFGTRMDLGYRLLNSKYGAPLFGKTQPLPEVKK